MRLRAEMDPIIAASALSAIIGPIRYCITLADEVRYAREASKIIKNEMEDIGSIIEGMDQATQRNLPVLHKVQYDRLTEISQDIKEFLLEAKYPTTPIQLLRILMGQYRIKVKTLLKRLSNTKATLSVLLQLPSNVNSPSDVVSKAAAENSQSDIDIDVNDPVTDKAIAEDIRQAKEEVRNNRVHTLIMSTYHQTQSNLTSERYEAGKMDSKIKDFITKRNISFAASKLLTYLEHGDAAEQKKAALFLGHCYRLMASSTTDVDAANAHVETSGYYYKLAHEKGSSTAIIYLAQYAAARGNSELASTYLERFMLTQEPDKTLWK
ncbi:hypothetical protein HDU96_000373 [Phlyctochytrium bullatum]|nr:hypothetical protein HDU96_000373 [Phlyctochytrium bullatum]